MRSDIQIGAKFPDYELPDQTGTVRKLSALQGDKPMVLTLSRGYYCPKDRLQHRNLVDFWPEMRVGYAKLVTISTDSKLTVNEFRDGIGAQWPFLFDEERIVQQDLDIQEYTDPHHDPMIPYTFILDRELTVFRIWNGYWYWGRPSNAELHQALRELFQTIRPDWDLGRPGLRDAWDRGEKDKFWPYGKTLDEVFGEG